MQKYIQEEKLDEEIEMLVVKSDDEIEYNKQLNIVIEEDELIENLNEMIGGNDTNDEKEDEESYLNPHSSQCSLISEDPEQPGGAVDDLSDWSSSFWTNSTAEETMLSSINDKMKEDIGEAQKVIKISSGSKEEATLEEEKGKKVKETEVSA